MCIATLGYTQTAKLECIDYTTYIKEYCYGCQLRQSNFAGVKITYNKKITYLWHPIQVKTEGGSYTMSDGFGTTFKNKLSNNLTYNTIKSIYSFINNCSAPSDIEASAPADFVGLSLTTFSAITQTSTIPVSIPFQTAVLTNIDSSNLTFDQSITGLTFYFEPDTINTINIAESGAYHIAFDASLIPSATGQVQVQVHVNNTNVYSQLLNCASIVSGYLVFAGGVSKELSMNDKVTLKLLRPTGTTTFSIISASLSLTKK